MLLFRGTEMHSITKKHHWYERSGHPLRNDSHLNTWRLTTDSTTWSMTLRSALHCFLSLAPLRCTPFLFWFQLAIKYDRPWENVRNLLPGLKRVAEGEVQSLVRVRYLGTILCAKHGIYFLNSVEAARRKVWRGPEVLEDVELSRRVSLKFKDRKPFLHTARASKGAGLECLVCNGVFSI